VHVSFVCLCSMLNVVLPQVGDAIRQLQSLGIRVRSIEWTQSDSAFIFATREGTNFYLELYYEDGKFVEAVTNVYRNKIQQLAVAGTVEYILSEYKANPL